MAGSKEAIAQLEAKKQLAAKAETLAQQQIEAKKQFATKTELLAMQQLEAKKQAKKGSK